MDIKNNIAEITNTLQGSNARLVAVSKTKPNELILEAYNAGQRVFGENKIQEMTDKSEALPKDIEWHMIGHVQRNKVKYMATFVSLIHSVDSWKLLKEVNKQALKNDRVIDCLLQMHIAEEETKFGLSKDELLEILESPELLDLQNIRIIGLMGMATFTEDKGQIRKEFKSLANTYNEVKSTYHADNIEWKELSMGMSGDYDIAIEEGSTLVRVGSSIFGSRNYNN
ncbi:YggS family pyridoxal phosphate-dependent enzyme [Fulvivirga lutimaris]|uniref:YggS family pyridoxal phosphate-dependent enzyme n=1 Tax=Fulvivirga lutimaris TaxID=1819566 RepID=UPI0012BC5FE0|nr:YggS family pyridoxal phosphate-dependent enzyme [Fulvivirga lutimaris]MTI38626.1 YggS family pyridoxal phosphate-dependent enzyme [Fulvivirga lutimaris]